MESITQCKHCTSSLPPRPEGKGRGRNPLYCSDPCRRAGTARRQKANYDPDKAKAYYQSNREQRLAYGRDYGKTYRERNPDKCRESSRRWYLANRESVIEKTVDRQRRYRQEARAGAENVVSRRYANRRMRGNAESARVCRTFDLLQTEAEREAYAHWLLFLALSECRYRDIIGRYEVDERIAHYCD
jgi:hypothetical protein